MPLNERRAFGACRVQLGFTVELGLGPLRRPKSPKSESKLVQDQSDRVCLAYGESSKAHPYSRTTQVGANLS